jgi:hypothetical protein
MIILGIIGISILILLIWDISILHRIYKLGKKGEAFIPDERYFELKYNINLLKGLATILIFVVGFLGYGSYNDLSKKVGSDINEIVDAQKDSISNLNKEIESFRSSIVAFKKSIDGVVSQKDNVTKELASYQREFSKTKKKLESLDKAISQNTKLYIVESLEFPFNIEDRNTKDCKFYFKEMKTITGIKLPEFEELPSVKVEGSRINLTVTNLTRDYIELSHSNFWGDGKDNYPDHYNFNLWIASTD